jgi:hypothetical protein
MSFFKLSAFIYLCFVWLLQLGISQDLPKDLTEEIDTIIGAAFQSAVTQLPCTVKTSGKPKLIRWQDVDKCLNNAAGNINWNELSGQLRALKAGARGLTESAFLTAVDSSISARAVAFDKVFIVKDPQALLPLTHSLLKYLPPDSLQDLEVYEGSGTAIGTFAGVYLTERPGGLLGNSNYRLARFQYKDKNGDLHAATDNLHLLSSGVPSYGVRWSDAMSQQGFRLTSEKLDLGR